MILAYSVFWNILEQIIHLFLILNSDHSSGGIYPGNYIQLQFAHPDRHQVVARTLYTGWSHDMITVPKSLAFCMGNSPQCIPLHGSANVKLYSFLCRVPEQTFELNKHSSCMHHYNDVIMGAIASQITSLTIVYSAVYSDADQRKHESSASLAFVRWISSVTGEFPAQMASNAENVSIWWRHHVLDATTLMWHRA